MSNNIWNKIHRFLWKIKIWTQENVRYIKMYSVIRDNKNLKDIYKGRRCFIIGNGPSLTVQDLETLHMHDEICFAANKIYQLFDKTEWRPDYYGICDSNLYKNNYEMIHVLNLEKFYPLDFKIGESEVGIIHRFSRVPFRIIRKKPKFSPDLTKRLSEGGTITFFLLQIAVYMGFRDIYLIGCDFNFSYGIDVNGNYFENKGVVNHFLDDGKKLDTMPNLQYNYWAYEASLDYARKNNLNIYNATRGGKLEVFPRVDFENLFTVS